MVKSWKDRFNGKDTVVKVLFSAKDGYFSIKLQPKIVEKLGRENSNVSSKTLADVEKQYWDAIKAYREAQTTKRKVIIYKVEANVNIHRVKEKEFFERNDISFGDGCGLIVYAEVAIEETHRQARGGTSVSYKRAKDMHLPRSMYTSDHGVIEFGARLEKGIHVIDWTLKREEWFAWVGRQLEDMVRMVSETLGSEDVGVALQIIDSGRALMEPKKSGKKKS